MSTKKVNITTTNPIPLANPERANSWRIGLIVVTVMTIPALWSCWRVMTIEPIYTHSVKLWSAITGWTILISGANYLTWAKASPKVQGWIASAIAFLEKSSTTNVTLLAGVVTGLIYLLVVYKNYALILSGVPTQLTLVITGVFLAGWLLHFIIKQSAWKCYIVAGLAFGVFWQALIFLPHSLNYPFKLNWSETSWYYYASSFFDQRIYGTSIPWPFLDIGRPVLLSAVYLIPHPPLWAMRIWQCFLWLGLSFLVALLLYRRLKSRGAASKVFLAWGFLWVLMGPLLFHLSIAVAIVLWGFNRTRFWKTMCVVGIASLWAGILRINWIPVPAMLAIGLYLLEEPAVKPINLIKYLRPPFFYGLIGFLSGIASFALYLYVSGQAYTRLGTKFLAPFLPYRLWPNATLSTGILPGILLVSAAALFIICRSSQKRRYHPLRIGLLFAMLAILFVGGLAASIRIGGGNNLHNLDAYLMLLMVCGAYAATNSVQPDEPGVSSQASQWAIVALCLTPALWGMLISPSLVLKNENTARLELGELKALVETASAQGDPILFVDQRHLITYGYIQVPLIADYELEELTEMVNAGNNEYLDRFYEDIASHKYGLIVVDSNSTAHQTRLSAFAEENNLWVDGVIIPLQHQYQVILTLPQSGIYVYAPKP